LSGKKHFEFLWFIFFWLKLEMREVNKKEVSSFLQDSQMETFIITNPIFDRSYFTHTDKVWENFLKIISSFCRDFEQALDDVTQKELKDQDVAKRAAASEAAAKAATPPNSSTPSPTDTHSTHSSVAAIGKTQKAPTTS
jgi:hypothetical protein